MRSVVCRVGLHQQIGTVCMGETSSGITCTSVQERLLAGTAAQGIWLFVFVGSAPLVVRIHAQADAA